MYRLMPEQVASIEELRRVAETEIAQNAAAVDANGVFPRPAIDALRKNGWLGLTIPKEYGGRGEGMRMACAAVDTIAQFDASAAMVYLMHICGCAVYAAAPGGSADLMREVAAGKHLSTLAFSERGSRSHFWAPVSQAKANGAGVKLNASKSFVTSAGEADGYVFSTRTAGGTEATDSTLYLIKKNDPGLAVAGPWDSLGLRGNASAPMSATDIAIAESRLLSKPSDGFRVMLEVVLPWFNTGSAAISCGIAEAAVAATATHLSKTSFEHMGTKLADLPNLRARLAEMRIELDKARAHLQMVLDAIENPGPTTVLLVLESKAASAEMAIRVTDLGMKACGGAAFSGTMSLERNFRDARAASVMAPTSDVLYDFIGKALTGIPLF